MQGMDAENGGTHAAAQDQEGKEGQGDLKACGEAEDHEPDTTCQQKDP